MLGIVNFLRGHVEVEIHGAFPERFLNVCATGGIAFWNLRRQSDTCMCACMHPSGFRKAEAFTQKTFCQIRITKKRGVPFQMSSIRRRYALLLGFLFTLGSLYGLSLFVWEFEVIGNQLVSTETILRNLAEIDVKPGMYGPSIDIATIKNEMLLRIDELSWLTVNRNGSHATVEVRERIPKPEIIPSDIPCHIVAAKDGVVLRVDALTGKAQVSAGETVTRGQTIVSGWLDFGEMGSELVHARADVYARTWYDLKAVMPLEYTGKEYTGRKQTRRVLVVAGQRLIFSLFDFSMFDNCDKLVKTTTLKLPFNITLPVSVVNECYVEYTPSSYSLPRQEAVQALKAVLSRQLDALLGEGEVMDADIQARKQGDVMVETLKAECWEQIAMTVPVEPGFYEVSGE